MNQYTKPHELKEVLEAISGDNSMLEQLANMGAIKFTGVSKEFMISTVEMIPDLIPGKRTPQTNVAVVTALLSAGLHNTLRAYLKEDDIPELSKGRGEVYAWRLCQDRKDKDELAAVCRAARRNPRCELKQRVRTRRHNDFPEFVWEEANSYIRYIVPSEFAVKPGFVPAEVLAEFMHHFTEDELLQGKRLAFRGKEYKLTLERD